MEPIYPLNEENLRLYAGQLVCVVIQDGTRHVGVLSGCAKGRLLLNDGLPDGEALEPGQAASGGKRTAGSTSGSRKRRGKTAASSKSRVAVTAAYPFDDRSFGYPAEPSVPNPTGLLGRRAALDLASIAFVLLIL